MISGHVMLSVLSKLFIFEMALRSMTPRFNLWPEVLRLQGRQRYFSVSVLLLIVHPVIVKPMLLLEADLHMKLTSLEMM